MLCQRCRLPLIPHKSMTQLGPTQFAMFTRDPELNNDIAAGKVDGNASKVAANASGGQTYTNNREVTEEEASFILLTESLAGPNPLRQNPNQMLSGDPLESLHHHHSRDADTLEKLYDFLMAKTDIDLPLCGDCAESVRSGLKTSYEDACAERDAYIAFMNRLKEEPSAGTSEMQRLQAQISQLENEVGTALKELKEAERDRDLAEKQLAEAEKSIEAQKARDGQVYSKRNEFELEAQRQAVEHRRLQALSDYQEMQLQRLQHTNAYNDLFCISHDGSFGTINGLRLGRLRDKRVEWNEINAAWGQTLLLMASVISRLGIRIPEYRLKPLGSMSRIEKLDLDPDTGEPTGRAASLELFSSESYSFERLLGHKRLDAAMVAFLDILSKVGQFVEEKDPGLTLPYVIDGERIGGCSIRLSLGSSNETWTAACKYVLTNAKWILAYVVAH